MNNTTLPTPLDSLSPKYRIQISLKRGEVLFNQGEPSSGMFYLAQGSISLKRTSEWGHEVTIHRAQPQQCFAEASLFTSSYHCTAIATTDAIAIKCQKQALLDLLNSDATFARAMLSSFASQTQASRRRVELLSIKSADERIMAAIHDGLLNKDIAAFAECISLAPETVYRALARLHKTGKLLKTARGQYRLKYERK